MQKLNAVLGIVVFVIVIAGAAFGYNTLRRQISPELVLADQAAGIATPVPSPEPVAQEAEATLEESEPDEPEKMKAPDFTVEDADGNSVMLSDMLGKPVVLNFWASWCPPCKAEMPEFDKVYTELGEDVVFMMVDLTDGQRETKEKGSKYVAKQGFTFPVYYDTGQDAASTYGIRSIPTTIFIDKDGYIITGAEGQLDEETLRYGISLLNTDSE